MFVVAKMFACLATILSIVTSFIWGSFITITLALYIVIAIIGVKDFKSKYSKRYIEIQRNEEKVLISSPWFEMNHELPQSEMLIRDSGSQFTFLEKKTEVVLGKIPSRYLSMNTQSEIRKNFKNSVVDEPSWLEIIMEGLFGLF
ncbi:MAG: hypothetical protein AAFP89_25605 [Bacteroidota bacterium]